MTSTQINAILTELGYEMDAWIDLPKITIIGVEQEIRFYPDQKHNKFRFNSAKNQMEVSEGNTLKGTYYSTFNETENFTPNHRIRFDSVLYFSRAAALVNGCYRSLPR